MNCICFPKLCCCINNEKDSDEDEEDDDNNNNKYLKKPRSKALDENEIEQLKRKRRTLAPRDNNNINTKNMIIKYKLNKGKSLRKKESLSKPGSNKEIFESKGHFMCLFCGGKKCKYENYLNNPNFAIKGLHCNTVDANIYLGQRPTNHLIKKFHLIKEFRQRNIGLIINLQVQGEHPYCGPGKIEPLTGFTYTPSLFLGEDIFVKKAGWRDIDSPDFFDFFLDIIREMTYSIKIEKKKIYVHCHSGMSRSGIVVACYKIFNDKLTPKEAADLVKQHRKGTFDKKSDIKYCEKFYDFCIRLRTIFTYENYNVNYFLKRQWDLDVAENNHKHSNYIPNIIFICINKILSFKFSPKNPYCNNAIYKALNGSLEIGDETYVQIKKLMEKINNGQWEALKNCESTVIVSEILYIWLDDSVKACVHPRRIMSAIISDYCSNNLDEVLQGNCRDLNILKNLYSLIKKTFKIYEVEIMKFISHFLDKLYPNIEDKYRKDKDKNTIINANTNINTNVNISSNKDATSSINNNSNIKNNNDINAFVSFNQKNQDEFSLTDITNDIINDNVDEYLRMKEKLAIYLVGYNIDYIYAIENENYAQFNAQNEIEKYMNNNNNYFNYIPRINNFDKNNNDSSNSKLNESQNIKNYTPTDVVQSLMKLFDFLRIYDKVQKNLGKTQESSLANKPIANKLNLLSNYSSFIKNKSLQSIINNSYNNSLIIKNESLSKMNGPTNIINNSNYCNNANASYIDEENSEKIDNDMKLSTNVNDNDYYKSQFQKNIVFASSFSDIDADEFNDDKEIEEEENESDSESESEESSDDQGNISQIYLAKNNNNSTTKNNTSKNNTIKNNTNKHNNSTDPIDFFSKKRNTTGLTFTKKQNKLKNKNIRIQNIDNLESKNNSITINILDGSKNTRNNNGDRVINQINPNNYNSQKDKDIKAINSSKNIKRKLDVIQERKPKKLSSGNLTVNNLNASNNNYPVLASNRSKKGKKSKKNSHNKLIANNSLNNNNYNQGNDYIVNARNNFQTLQYISKPK